ncbi:MAG: pectate lyase, partial [Prevotellaceae bacterium]|nr:pectate lyase [Prevotellaceae bacterium]
SGFKFQVIRQMKRIAFTILSLVMVQASFASSAKEIKQTMKKATMFMMDSISHQGGFVWSYLSDRSRCWGEMEATESMVWIQSTSTPEVGNILIDAYKATNDEYYYQQACKVADVLIRGQHPSGGWNYCFDLNGEESLKQWYKTVGQSGWRLEEFQHYYGNATFDDEVTANVAHFFLNIYRLKKDAKYKAVLDKVIGFICDSQYDNGGWPQRFPLMYDHPFRGKADYSSFITLNDEVLLENISFLQECIDSLGMDELKPRVEKAMFLIPKLQQPKPYAGWSDQYTLDLKPAHARSYEPRGVNTATTMKMIGVCRDLYEKTGDSVFIRRLPDAIEFLKSQRLGDEDLKKWGQPSRDPDAFLVPRFVDPDNGLPLYVHRRGSNVFNGEYYINQDLSNTIGHYSSAAWVNLKWVNAPRPHNYSRRFFGDTNVDGIISSLTPSGAWLSPLHQISNPYKDAGKQKPSNETKYASTNVGDEFDTSPYTPEQPVMGIVTGTYVRNMSMLMNALKEKEKAESFAISNGKGMEMTVTNYGGRVVSLMVPNKKNEKFDVVLGFDSLADYARVKQNFGATVGRYIGRIKNADGTITAHGGKPGFANRYFDIKAKTDNSITLEYVSPDGESGFNGELTLDVTYTLTDDNSLRIDYEATTTKPTHLNPSNHSFFNLTGFAGNAIKGETFWLAADSILEFDANKNVTGEILPVKKTKFDFTKKHKIVEDYDHCFKLREHSLNDVVARLVDKNTGLTMEVFTTEPGMQVYTANSHRGNIIGKGGTAYPKNNAICLETMHFHDSPNQPHFPSTSLNPGETFHSTTIYHFK